MNSSRRVRKILQNALAVSLAATGAAACSSIDTDGFNQVACGTDTSPRYLDGAKPAEAADYIELRDVSDIGGPVRVIESMGTKCGSATDKAACEAAFDAVMSTEGFVLGTCADLCTRSLLVVNRGDNVEVVDTKDAVKTLLAPIDAPSEAVLMAAINGYSVSCNNSEEGGVRSSGSGYEVLGTKYTSTCNPIERKLYVLGVSSAGDVKEIDSEVLESNSGACIGRRPAGLVAKKGRGRTAVGAYFASVAHFEAASVTAFETLEAELLQHGAPKNLVRRARRARNDEVRHARVMGRVAERYGAVAPSPTVARRPLRSLEAIALDNAVEGCVRETFGALVGLWQATRAVDPAVRDAMRAVALDESRHAALSWAIDAWIRPRLSAKALAKIEKKQREALDQIIEEARRGNDSSLVELAGLPDAVSGERLARNFIASMSALAAA